MACNQTRKKYIAQVKTAIKQIFTILKDIYQFWTFKIKYDEKHPSHLCANLLVGVQEEILLSLYYGSLDQLVVT